jgi:hypothetical protein
MRSGFERRVRSGLWPERLHQRAVAERVWAVRLATDGPRAWTFGIKIGSVSLLILFGSHIPESTSRHAPNGLNNGSG